MDIKVDDGYVQINSKPNMPRIDYEAGSVETSMSQQPSISIRYVGENIDKFVWEKYHRISNNNYGGKIWK